MKFGKEEKIVLCVCHSKSSFFGFFGFFSFFSFFSIFSNLSADRHRPAAMASDGGGQIAQAGARVFCILYPLFDVLVDRIERCMYVM